MEVAMKIKKRFIAGAHCPECKSQDSLRWWMQDAVEQVECVECDYQKQKTSEAVAESEHSQDQMIGIFKPD